MRGVLRRLRDLYWSVATLIRPELAVGDRGEAAPVVIEPNKPAVKLAGTTTVEGDEPASDWMGSHILPGRSALYPSRDEHGRIEMAYATVVDVQPDRVVLTLEKRSRSGVPRLPWAHEKVTLRGPGLANLTIVK